MPVLEVRGLRVGGAAPEIRGLHLAVDAGEAIAVLTASPGAPGAIAAALAGVAPAEAGSVVLDGSPVDGLDASARAEHGLVLVSRGGGPLPGLTVAEELRAGGWLRRDDPGFVEGRQRRCLRWFPSLADRLAERSEALPPVERLLVGLARALMTRPRVLVVDRPAWRLDPGERRRILGAVELVVGADVAVVLLDRHVGILDVASRAVVVRDGATVYNGPARELRTSVELRRDLLWPRRPGA